MIVDLERHHRTCVPSWWTRPPTSPYAPRQTTFETFEPRLPLDAANLSVDLSLQSTDQTPDHPIVISTTLVEADQYLANSTTEHLTSHGPPSQAQIRGQTVSEATIQPTVPNIGTTLENALTGIISGFVFQDGPQLFTPDGQLPDNLRTLRDGTLSPDDTPLPSITLELRNGITSEPIMANQTAPGTYSNGPVRTTTNHLGYYQFTGLPTGNYAVFQIHPEEYSDGIDTAGTTSGIAVNQGDPLNPLILDQLIEDPKNDAIIRIPLPAGEHSQLNNFSEIAVRQEPIAFPFPQTARPVPTVKSTRLPTRVSTNRPITTVQLVPLTTPELNGSGGNASFHWHLSIVDAGRPRGDAKVEHGDSTTWLTGTLETGPSFNSKLMKDGRWRLALIQNGKVLEFRHDVFGTLDGFPITGDWDGDGLDEYGIFVNGEWLLDLNGDRVWNRYDLWAKLGEPHDRPITGDWDGDGKEDIGCFGPAWIGDQQAIVSEAGLPDADNRRAGSFKNLPPDIGSTTIGNRLLKRTPQGRTRADLIDHVFHYGPQDALPVTGDWNGDGIDSIGIFRKGMWQLDENGDGKTSSDDPILNFGQRGDIPVTGDWNGDGKDDIGVYRSGTWILDTNNNQKIDPDDQELQLGSPGELPITGDWDGDGKDDIGVYGEVITNVAAAHPMHTYPSGTGH